MTHYIDAILIKRKHPIWTWKQCVYWARQERREAPPINWTAVLNGITATCGGLLLFWMYLSRPGCGV